MMIQEPPVCFDCKHFDINKLTCSAFAPGPIPEEILNGDNEHSKPLPGQGNEIVFEPIQETKSPVNSGPSGLNIL